MSASARLRPASWQRREGTSGEIATVRERLDVVGSLLRHDQESAWRGVYWHEEQCLRLVERIAERSPCPEAAALGRSLTSLGRYLVQIDLLLTEARAEINGAIEHLGNVAAAVRIDQYLADQVRDGLDAEAIDRLVNRESAKTQEVA